jgi:chromosome segregation ATPase
MQEQIKTFQTAIKDTSSKIQKIQPEYNQLHLEYNSLVNQKESILKRIQEIEPEIARLQQEEKETHETVHSTKKHSKMEPETSEDIMAKLAETDSKVQEKIDQIRNLKQKLSDLGLSNPESPVNLRSDIIEHLKHEIEQTQLKLDELISEFRIEEKVSQITNNLKILQDFSNNILTSIDFTLRFLLSIDMTSESPIKLEIKLQHKNKELAFNDELKRVEKAMVAISLILGILALSKQPIIPIHFDTLPEYIITKQTFLKLLENFRPLIEANPEWMKRIIVFFLTEATPEVSPKIII